MPEFCDVALPVPLDLAFTYRVPDGMQPVVGGRVLVHSASSACRESSPRCMIARPRCRPKTFSACLMLHRCSMSNSFGWANGLRITIWRRSAKCFAPCCRWPRSSNDRSDIASQRRTDGAAPRGNVRLVRAFAQDAPDQLAEFRALDYLAERETVREESLRAATRVSKSLLTGMVRKKWIVREDLSDARDAARTMKVALLKTAEGKLNSNQQLLIETLAAAGGRLSVENLQTLDVPRTTLATLVKRGLVGIVEEPVEFAVARVKARPSPLDFQFNSAQQDALMKIEESVRAVKFSGMLLHGVTGSGKTAVYLAAMRSVLETGRSAILLVPEIGLTPAVAGDLHHVFGEEVAILHSALSDQERAEQWHRIKRGEARMVVGTRSAVFAPVENLALMIVDEEQDSSYKQEETPRYHARDVAVMRAKMAGAVVVLGSATPSLESYFNAKKNKYALLELPDRVERRPLPEVEIVDMRVEFQETGKEQVISRKLVEEIRQRLDRKEQAMVLLNRRGYSPVALCRACGNRMECRNCAIAMTHHKRSNRMVCHYCGFMAPVPKVCGECGSEYVYFLGTGSEKLEELLHGFFPQARIGRLDRDTVRGNEDFERALNALNEGELDLLVGTQMIAKGHDIHGVTLVGVVGADAALGFPDFRAAERTFQLLTQVAGRAGRGQTPGKVVLQTYFPDHYAVNMRLGTTSLGFMKKSCAFAVGCIIRRTARWRMCWCGATNWMRRYDGRAFWVSGSRRLDMKASG